MYRNSMHSFYCIYPWLYIHSCVFVYEFMNSSKNKISGIYTQVTANSIQTHGIWYSNKNNVSDIYCCTGVITTCSCMILWMGQHEICEIWYIWTLEKKKHMKIRWIVSDIYVKSDLRKGNSF